MELNCTSEIAVAEFSIGLPWFFFFFFFFFLISISSFSGCLNAMSEP